MTQPVVARTHEFLHIPHLPYLAQGVVAGTTHRSFSEAPSTTCEEPTTQQMPPISGWVGSLPLLTLSVKVPMSSIPSMAGVHSRATSARSERLASPAVPTARSGPLVGDPDLEVAFG